jgi:hypothetical protein
MDPWYKIATPCKELLLTVSLLSFTMSFGETFKIIVFLDIK